MLIAIQHFHIRVHGKGNGGEKLSEMDIRTGSHKSHTDENENTMSMHVESTASGMIALLFMKKACFSFGVKKGTEFPHLLESSIVAVLSLSHVLVLCDPTDYCTPGSSVLHTSRSLLRFVSIESVNLGAAKCLALANEV